MDYYFSKEEVNRNSYMVSDGKHVMPAELSGRFLFDAEDAIDYPTVGDWVTIQAMDDGKNGQMQAN